MLRQTMPLMDRASWFFHHGRPMTEALAFGIIDGPQTALADEMGQPESAATAGVDLNVDVGHERLVDCELQALVELRVTQVLLHGARLLGFNRALTRHDGHSQIKGHCERGDRSTRNN